MLDGFKNAAELDFTQEQHRKGMEAAFAEIDAQKGTVYPLIIGGERIFTEMLPLVDDFERAIAVMDKTNDIDAVREGIKLIQQKFLSFLDKNDVHPIQTEDADFNTDEHEAVTTFAAGEEKKGKVIDCTQKGYKLGDKVIRFAKVVVGE